MRGYALRSATLRLAQAVNGSGSLTILGSGQLAIPGFSSVTAQVEGVFNSDGSFLLRGATSSALGPLGDHLINPPVDSMAAGSTARLTQTGLTVDGTVSGGIINDFTVVTAIARLLVPSDGSNPTLTGCITVESLVFGEFRLESTQPGGRFEACFGPNGLTFPAGARLLYRNAGLTTPSLPPFTIAADGSFTIDVDGTMTVGASLNGYAVHDLRLNLIRSASGFARGLTPRVVKAQSATFTVSIPSRNPGFSSTTTLSLGGEFYMDGSLNLSGTAGNNLTLSGLPFGTVNASAVGSVRMGDTGFLTVTGTFSGGVLNRIPLVASSITLTVEPTGVTRASGTVTTGALNDLAITVEPSVGPSFVWTVNGTALTLPVPTVRVRVTGVINSLVALPPAGIVMDANGDFAVTMTAGGPGFLIVGYDFTGVSFALRRTAGTLSIGSLQGDLNISRFGQHLTGSVDHSGNVTLDFNGGVTLGGFVAANGQLHLRTTGLSASGTLNLTAAGHSFGSLAVAGSISANGDYTFNSSTTLNIGGYTTTLAALKVSPTGVCNGDHPDLNYGGLSVSLPNYCLTTGGISPAGNATAPVDSGWQGFGGTLNGRAAGTVSLSFAADGAITASLSWTLAYWFDRFDCNCRLEGPPPVVVCDMCPRPELNDSKLNNQKATGGGSISSTGVITLNHTFAGVNVTDWRFDLW